MDIYKKNSCFSIIYQKKNCYSFFKEIRTLLEFQLPNTDLYFDIFVFIDILLLYLVAENVDFFFVDTTPFVDKYFIEDKGHNYDWRGILPRKRYISNLLKVILL